MELDTLKAKIVGTSKLSKTLTKTAASADRVADSMREGAVAGAELAASAGRTEEEAVDLARSLGKANRELASGAAEGAVYAEGMSEVAQEQAEASAAAALFEQRLERVGDEATQSAAQVGAFSSSVGAANASSLSANLAGLSGSIKTVGALAAVATPAVLGLGSALGGLATFSGVGAIGAGGLTVAGIQGRAKEMAELSSEYEDAAAAREELLSGFTSRLGDAFEPIQNADVTQQFALRNLDAVVDVAEDASAALQGVDDTVIGVASGLREATVATSPELFGELATQTERLAPLFSRLDGAIRDVPQLINFLGDATARVGPDLFTFAAAAVPVAAGLADVGLAASDVLLPALSGLLFVTGGVLGTFQALPDPLQNVAAGVVLAAGAAYAGSAAMGVFAGSTFTATLATQGLIAALGTLTLPISGTALAIAALAGAVLGLASHFGLLDDAAEVVTGTWNGFVDLLEIGANSALWAADALTNLLGPFTMLIPVVGPALYVLGNLETILTKAGDAADWLGEKIKWLAEMTDRHLSGVLDKLDRTSEKSEEMGGVSFDGARFGDGGDGSDDGRSGPSGGSGGPPPVGAAATTGSQSGASDQSVNIDTLVVEDKSGNAEQTADKVIKKLEKERRRQGGHPTG